MALSKKTFCILNDKLYSYSCKNMSLKIDQEGTVMEIAKASLFTASCLVSFYP